ncbi:MAG TPA: hypothetical protein DCE41_08625 [Cytophagales bacterium]|nr:hypothetical protein [Cytophagales bacterium]HAA21677.1 hypothetical protein [Cytophagales bacterium]HAP63736.1 hypothetical protein [Cytophagales bacterium]
MVNPGNVVRWLALSLETWQGGHPKGRLHRECRRYAHEIIQTAGEVDPGFEGSHIYRKMIWYMVLDLWLGIQVHRLHGSTPTRADRRRYALSAPVFAAADYLIDDTDRPLAGIEAFTRDPDSQPDFPHHALFRAFHNAFLASLDPKLDRDRVLEAYHRVHRVQFDSRGQKDAEASAADIDLWVRDKTGYTYQMVRSMVPIAELPDEADVWYQLGALTQYCNDIQDLHRDLESGVRNSATELADSQSIKRNLRQQQRRAYEVLSGLAIASSSYRRVDFMFEAFVLIMEAKLDWYDRVCGGQFTSGKLLQLTRQQTYLPPWSLFSLRRCLVPLLGYRSSK